MKVVDRKYNSDNISTDMLPGILIIEDDEGLNHLIQKTLKREGLNVEGVSSGEEAVSKIENDQHRILLLDYILPDMTGKEIIKILDEKKLKVPFIIMTGHGDEKTAVEMMKLGARDYIIKDVTLIDMLPHVIKRIIKEIKGERELAEAEKAVNEWQTDMSILYQISTAISQTIDMEKLFDIILDTITGLEIFDVDKQAGIFLIEDDRMNLVSSRGNPESFVKVHKSIRIGDCLCGLSAKTGEVIISRNCNNDSRHTIRFPGMKPHGHIIIPLKARGMIIGVLFLYLKADAEIHAERLKLLTSIGNQIGIAIENARLYEETKKFALHDPLTGLANRRMMHIVFDRTIESAKRFKKTFSIIMLDIDYFKRYNDNYGHSKGDDMLIEIAGLAKKETRQIDLVVRYGGEEFLVLLPDTDLPKALEAAERMRKTIESTTGVTISLGIVSYKDEIRIEDLIKKADKALYSAKQSGRNRIEISN